jgi:hypothetical protein
VIYTRKTGSLAVILALKAILFKAIKKNVFFLEQLNYPYA